MNLSAADFVIFDCDGVLIDSNKLKGQAFLEVIKSESSDDRSAFSAYHKQHGGISRNSKFTWFYRDYLRRTNWQKEVEEGLKKFKSEMESSLLEASLVPGIQEFLQYLNAMKKKCIVISAGADDELISILKQKGLISCFLEVLGNSNNKFQHIERLLEKKVINGAGIYFGDSLADYEAAKKFDLEFIFVSGYTLWGEGLDFCNSENIEIIPDFCALGSAGQVIE